MIETMLALALGIGCAGITFGAWLVYEPAGFIVGGLIMVVVPLLYVRGSWDSSTE